MTARLRTAVITGASAGVGRAVAHRFAREGVRLGLIAREAESLEQVRRETAALGAEALSLPLDVADAAAVEAAGKEAERRLGPIDVWVNDAMATVFSPVSEISAEEYRRVTEVTYLGCVHGTMAALKLMRPRGRGAIVQVGSALAYRGIPLQAAYCGAKHAIRGFTNSLRTELLHDRSAISLSIVELPAMNTPQFEWARTHMPDRPRPMGRVYQPEAAAEAVWKAASRGGREYWLGRTTVMTILGNTIAPGLMDRLLARTAVDGQSRGVPVSPKRRDNLFSPVGPLHATHGAFDGQAHDGALLVSGEAARAGAVIAGALGFLGLGLALGRLARN